MKQPSSKGYTGRTIGLYFGSFNPVHIGHMAIANYMVEFTEMDEFWFVVTPQNPHKEKKNLLNDYDRLELVQRAVEGDHRLQVSDIEFFLPKPSYTIDTLVYLKERNPNTRFKILMGSDNLGNFPKWKNYEAIVENYGVMVYPRHGFSSSLGPQHKNIVIAKEAPMMEISSSFIRKAIKKGKDVRHFLPSKTWEYIEKMGFYH
jgi:nicotinate-nucleotide adenylyltransferase